MVAQPFARNEPYGCGIPPAQPLATKERYGCGVPLAGIAGIAGAISRTNLQKSLDFLYLLIYNINKE